MLKYLFFKHRKINDSIFRIEVFRFPLFFSQARTAVTSRRINKKDVNPDPEIQKLI